MIFCLLIFGRFLLSIAQEKVTKTRGGTNLYAPLHSLLLLQPTSTPLNVLLISDGHINSDEMILSDLMINCTSLRLFTLGIRLVDIVLKKCRE